MQLAAQDVKVIHNQRVVRGVPAQPIVDLQAGQTGQAEDHEGLGLVADFGFGGRRPRLLGKPCAHGSHRRDARVTR